MVISSVLKGKGGMGRGGGPAGDVLITTNIAPNAVFDRKGDDLVSGYKS